jgi:hypothetical protein
MTLKRLPVQPRRRSALVVVNCRDCVHACVGPGERCRCTKGWWADLPLDEVRELRGPCGDYAAAE